MTSADSIPKTAKKIDDDTRPIYTEKRLSRNLNNEALAAPIEQAILKDGARSVTSDTLLLVDPTEIRKEYSYKMQYVTRVRYASRSSKENCEIHLSKYTSPFIYKGVLIFTSKKLGNLQSSARFQDKQTMANRTFSNTTSIT